MKQLLKSLVLFILAIFITCIPLLLVVLAFTLSSFLGWVLLLVFLLFPVFHLGFKNGPKGFLPNLTNYLSLSGYWLDVSWNVLYGPILDFLLCNWTTSYYSFGKKESISSALGKNIVGRKDGHTYTNTGLPTENKILIKLAQAVDWYFLKFKEEENHCIKWIDNKV